MVFIDRNYRTGINVSFYDRVREVKKLEEYLDRYSTVIIYGPKGVGKSEIVRYFLKTKNYPSVIIDAREENVKTLVEEPLKLSDVVNKIASMLGESSWIIKLHYVVYEIIDYFINRIAGENFMIVFDEFHLLSRDKNEAVKDLISMAGFLAKNHKYKNFKVIVTASEGFITSYEVFSKIIGYNTTYMVIEEIDDEHFDALFEEYKQNNSINQRLGVIKNVVGKNPGLIREIDDEEKLKNFIEHEKIKLTKALIRTYSEVFKVDYNDVFLKWKNIEMKDKMINLVLEFIGKKINPLLHPQFDLIGEKLCDHNILYPVFEKDRIIYKPQIPLYLEILKIIGEKEDEGITEELINRLKNNTL
ncbi:MAG: ATP-binding protein [Thermoprotei archaeon]